jgi:hypothetical protein
MARRDFRFEGGTTGPMTFDGAVSQIHPVPVNGVRPHFHCLTPKEVL